MTTISKNLNVKIPKGIKEGQKIRLTKDGGFGYMNVKIQIEVEENQTEEQKELYKKLLETNKK